MIIISAERPGLSPTGKLLNTQDLLIDLLYLVQWDGLVYPIEGSWEGLEENAFAIKIKCPDDDVINHIANGVIMLAKKYSQEYIGGFNPESDPPRMSIIDVETGECTPYAIGMSDMKPPANLYPSWTRIQGMYYFPIAELTVPDLFEAQKQVDPCDICPFDPEVCTGCSEVPE